MNRMGVDRRMDLCVDVSVCASDCQHEGGVERTKGQEGGKGSETERE